MSDVVAVHLYVKDMNTFKLINDIYKTFFGINPPIRFAFLPGLRVMDGGQS